MRWESTAAKTALRMPGGRRGERENRPGRGTGAPSEASAVWEGPGRGLEVKSDLVGAVKWRVWNA